MSDGSNFYICDEISTNNCLYLGKFYLKDAYNAAKKASNGASYGTKYNYNSWCENFAWYLDKRNITVHWNCICVL